MTFWQSALRRGIVGVGSGMRSSPNTAAMIMTAVVPTALLFSIFSGLTTRLSADRLDPFMSGMHLALWILVAFSPAGAAVSALRGGTPRAPGAGV